jgi:hypothetical protein
MDTPDSSNIPLDEAPLIAVLFEPAIGVILAQHACHELFGKDKIVKKKDRDLPRTALGWALEAS